LANLTDIVKTKLDNSCKENKNKAEEKCFEAKSFIQQAAEANKEDVSALLLQAFDLYSEALEFNSKELRAYHGLAFIGYTMGESAGALGFLNQALYYFPDSADTLQMIDEVKNDIRNGKLSKVISKHAGKTLSDSIKSIKTEKPGFFDKLSSVFASKIIKKSASRIPASGLNHSAASVGHASESKSTPVQGGGDYLAMVREAKNHLKK
jgi:hypothetical protein